MQKQGMLALAALIGGIVLGYAGKTLTGKKSSAPQTSTGAERPPWAECYLQDADSQTPLFSLGGKTYSSGDMPLDMQFRLSMMLGEEFRRQQTFLEQAGLRLAMAKDKGIDTQGGIPDLVDLYPDEMKISDEDVKKFFEANKQSFPPKITLEAIKPTIINYIRRDREQKIVAEFRQKMPEGQGLKWSVQPQCPPPMTFNTKAIPQVGSGDKMDLTVVTGFLCRSCREVWPTMEETLTANAERMTWRPFYLVRPGSAVDAYLAKGIHCAAKSGQPQLAAFVRAGHMIPIQYDNDLKSLADHVNTKILPDLKIDIAEFGKCLESEEAIKYEAMVAQLSQKTSLPNRPYFVVNGRLLQLDTDSDMEHAKALRLLFH